MVDTPQGIFSHECCFVLDGQEIYCKNCIYIRKSMNNKILRYYNRTEEQEKLRISSSSNVRLDALTETELIKRYFYNLILCDLIFPNRIIL